jgi:hypothetical protein
MAYNGMTVGRMIDFIVSVCKKRGWDTNRAAVIELVNMAVAEFEAHSELNLAYWEQVTEANVNAYQLPLDINYVHDAFIVSTGDDGGKPLKKATFKQIQASLANDESSDVVEP